MLFCFVHLTSTLAKPKTSLHYHSAMRRPKIHPGTNLRFSCPNREFSPDSDGKRIILKYCWQHCSKCSNALVKSQKEKLPCPDKIEESGLFLQNTTILHQQVCVLLSQFSKKSDLGWGGTLWLWESIFGK